MLDKDRLGSAMWARVKTIAGPFVPGIAGPQDALGETIWKGIADEIINEFKTNGNLKFLSGDIKILPGTFLDSLSAPVTGLAENQAVTLTGKIE